MKKLLLFYVGATMGSLVILAWLVVYGSLWLFQRILEAIL